MASLKLRISKISGQRVEALKMDQPIVYCKPNIVVLGRVPELIRGTQIKGHRGVVEAIRWRILPAYDLDE